MYRPQGALREHSLHLNIFFFFYVDDSTAKFYQYSFILLKPTIVSLKFADDMRFLSLRCYWAPS